VRTRVPNEADKRAIVIDTSALIAGFDPFSTKEELFTVPDVRGEMIEDTMSWLRFKTAIDSGRVKVRKPRRANIEKAKVFALDVGDCFLLSQTDIHVLALALELKTNGYSPLIATDDYSIQNVASQMKIDFVALSSFGIRRRLQWMRYCPGCRREYPTDYKSLTCHICGTRLKRKPLKRDDARRG